ncbi:hypothetical protein KXS11_09820 [Plantibacter flavus]|uniref:hypothetical protein n=1 Tax=Plantibacter flavus TaxID=150123 RepID=UPI003F1874AB
MADSAEPTRDQLEASDKVEKRHVGGEIRYYLKNLRDHLVTIEDAPDLEGHEAWWDEHGHFHCTQAQLRRDAFVGGIV